MNAHSITRSRNRRALARRLAFGMIMVLGGPAGCGDSAEPLEAGEVEVQWLVGPHGCADARTSTVEVVAVDDGPLDGRTWAFACDSRGGRVPGVSPGTYTFELRALDDAQQVTFVGITDRVQVRPGGVTVVPPVPLQAAPADLEVEWNFGGPLCGQVGVASVAVRVFDMNATIVNDATLPCEDGKAVMVVPPGRYDVVVTGIDDESALRYEAVFSRDLARGDRAWQQVTLANVAASE